MLLIRAVLQFLLLGAAAGSRRVSSRSSWDRQHALGGSDDESLARPTSPTSKTDLLDSTIEVLETMQEEYFENWLGTWPTAIDWTAAVMGTHVSGALSSISRALHIVPATEATVDRHQENLVTLFFSQVLGFYFGQDSFAVRNEAYDDILWVVLGWLETIQFINLHTDMTSGRVLADSTMSGYMGEHGFQKWHGNIWIPAFSHRTRIFWNLARSGWDTDLCGGGMTWNPRLEPYKNAITNQLMISASASMYLHFPGDWNSSPFFASEADGTNPAQTSYSTAGNDIFRPSDPAFYRFAVDGYNWLEASGMKNDKGLYIDGFHVSGWKDPDDTNTKCDVRNEQVYTYNQGVILTGQLSLWKITGNYTYVRDGHALIRSVIAATGWDLHRQRPSDHGVPHGGDTRYDKDWRWSSPRLPPWHGLGRAGILEEACDSRATCSQDAQTFKGIFFHHLTAFCGGPPPTLADFRTVDYTARDDISRHISRHVRACAAYEPWLGHNARAMLATRNERGEVGMWWTAGLLNIRDRDDMPSDERDGADVVVPGAVDYRNDGVPDDPTWRRSVLKPPSLPDMPLPASLHGDAADGDREEEYRAARNESDSSREEETKGEKRRGGARRRRSARFDTADLNDRNRGRTVETQGGGLALLRAYWEVSDGPGRAAAAEAERRIGPGDSDEL